jgi:hypothetical protein
MTRIKHFFFKLLSWVLPDRLCVPLMRKQIEKLKGALEDVLATALLEILLDGMSLAFVLLRGFRRNLAGFSGKYLFRTANDGVARGALFASRRMQVLRGEFTDYDVAVTFKNSAGLLRFLFSRDQDILDSLLANDVAVDGNVNFIYKFAFMARDLIGRLKLADLIDRVLARLRVA